MGCGSGSLPSGGVKSGSVKRVSGDGRRAGGLGACGDCAGSGRGSVAARVEILPSKLPMVVLRMVSAQHLISCSMSAVVDW